MAPRSSPALPLAVLTLATFVTVTVEMMPSGVLPQLSADLGVSQGTAGLSVSAWALAIAVGAFPLVRLTLRVPRRVVLTATLVVMTVGNTVTASAPTFAVVLVGRVAAALAHGLFWAVVVAYVATLVSPQRLGRALAIVLAGPTFAGLAGLPLMSFMADAAGWRVAFGLGSVALIVAVIAVWIVLPPGGSESAAVAPATSWDRSGLGVLAAAVGGGMVLVGHFAAFTYIATITVELGGWSAGSVPLLLLLFGLAGGVGVAVSGLAADRHPRLAVVVAAASIAVGLAATCTGTVLPGGFLVGVLLWGVGVGAFPPLLQARVLRLASPAFRPVAGSIVIAVLNLGIAGGALVGGVAPGQLGQVLVAAGFAACGAAGLVLVRPTGGRAGAPVRRERERDAA